MDHKVARRGRKSPLRRPEASLRRSLCSRSGNLREGAGSSVPPRGLQPVLVEPVLDLFFETSDAPASRGVLLCAGAAIQGIFEVTMFDLLLSFPLVSTAVVA